MLKTDLHMNPFYMQIQTVLNLIFIYSVSSLRAFVVEPFEFQNQYSTTYAVLKSIDISLCAFSLILDWNNNRNLKCSSGVHLSLQQDFLFLRIS